MHRFVMVIIAALFLTACAPVAMTATPVPPTATIVPTETPKPASTPALAGSPTVTVTLCAQREAASAVEALAKNIDTFSAVSNAAVASAVSVSEKRTADRDSAGLILVATQKTSVPDCARTAYTATVAYMQNTLDFIDAITPEGKLDNKDKWLAANDAASAAMKTELKALAAIAGVSIDGRVP
jgi:hypothetical protein